MAVWLATYIVILGPAIYWATVGSMVPYFVAFIIAAFLSETFATACYGERIDASASDGQGC